MRNLSILAAFAWIMCLSACSGGNPGQPTADGSGVAAFNSPTIPPTGIPSAPAAAPSVSPTAFSTSTSTPSPSQPPTLGPNAWQSMPVVPSVGENARRIYRDGLGFGNDPHAFSIMGDCLSLPNNFFGDLGKGPAYYKLGEYTYLEPAIEWFTDSFNRQSVTLGDGFNSASVLSPLWADPKRCEKNESPMECEYRIHRPSFVFISLGTDDKYTPPKTYEERMRKIVEYTLSEGMIPILATKADNREGNFAFNRILANLAYEYGVPLWNFWAAVQPLYLHGLADSHGHLTWADPDNFESEESLKRGVPVRSLTALQTLDSVWRGVTAP
jgi:hypothetical protein